MTNPTPTLQDAEGLTTERQMKLFGTDLVNLLRREGQYSGVWFSHRLLQAADVIEAQHRQVEEMREAAVELWALLDNIDTLDDICREDDVVFRTSARVYQRQRFQIMSGEQWDALRQALSTPSMENGK